MDYTPLLDDISDQLFAHFGVTDRTALEILLAARIPAPIPYPWLMLETNVFSLSFDQQWFGFGIDTKSVKAMEDWRKLRPRYFNEQLLEDAKSDAAPCLIVESTPERPLAVDYHFTAWPYIQQRTLHLRAQTPKKPTPPKQAFDQLRYDVTALMDNKLRPAKVSPAQPPARILFWIELLQKLNPTLRDWTLLLKCLTEFVSRRAYLYNRPTSMADWQWAVRLLTDSIPLWKVNILNKIANGGGKYGGCSRNRLMSLTGRGPNDHRLMRKQLEILRDSGFIYCYRQDWKLEGQGDYTGKGLGENVMKLIRGEVKI